MGENKVLNVLSTVLSGIFGGVILAGIQLMVIQRSTFQPGIVEILMTCVLSMFLPACLDFFARYEFPVWISECIVPVVSMLVGIVYLRESAMNQNAWISLLRYLVLFNACALGTVLVRIMIGLKKGEKDDNTKSI